MKNIVVVGSQWGDEGKGKIVDWLSEQADVIIRFQGGHNAGHTLVIDGTTYKLRLLPSGIVRKNKISMIGNGVVIDPWALLDEIEEIREKGIKIDIDNFIDVKGWKSIGNKILVEKIRSGTFKHLNFKKINDDVGDINNNKKENFDIGDSIELDMENDQLDLFNEKN